MDQFREAYLTFLENRTGDNYATLQAIARRLDRGYGMKYKLIDTAREAYEYWKQGI